MLMLIKTSVFVLQHREEVRTVMGVPVAVPVWIPKAKSLEFLFLFCIVVALVPGTFLVAPPAFYRLRRG